MIALPNSNQKRLKKDIDFILSLAPEHISSYILKIEQNTVFYKKYDTLNLPDDDDIAEQYLDSNGINLDDVREAYIDRFISRNAKTDTMAHNYLQGCMYTFLAEVMLVFTKITEDNTRYNAVVNAVGNKGNLALIESAVEQFVEELETDEYEEEMTYALESL
jgi:hypothetical protein